MRRILALLLMLGLAACATAAPPRPPGPGGPVLLDWRAIIRPTEEDRLSRLGEAWSEALSEARADGHEMDIARLGDLVAPNAALNDVRPPLGDYRCRTIKLGTKAGNGLAFVAYGWFACRIESSPKGMKFVKLTGSQRPSGLLFPDSRRRMIMLGSIALGDDPPANSYGQNPDKDVVGVLERLSGGRWRIVFPWPNYESDLDLLEIEPKA